MSIVLHQEGEPDDHPITFNPSNDLLHDQGDSRYKVMDLEKREKHCRDCRCALVQDELRLLLMGETMLGGTKVDSGQGNDSQSHQTADEYWFGRTSISEANGAPVKSFPDHFNLRSPPSMVSFPSSGNLVCSSPAVPASMPCAGAELLQLHGQ